MSLTVLSSPIPAGLSGLMTADAAADISSEGQGFSALLASQLNSLPGLELALDDVAIARQALKGELAGGPDRPVRSGISLQEMLAAARATRPLQKPSEGLGEDTRTTGSSGLAPWLPQANTDLQTSAPLLADAEAEGDADTHPESPTDAGSLALLFGSPPPMPPLPPMPAAVAKGQDIRSANIPGSAVGAPIHGDLNARNNPFGSQEQRMASASPSTPSGLSSMPMANAPAPDTPTANVAAPRDFSELLTGRIEQAQTAQAALTTVVTRTAEVPREHSAPPPMQTPLGSDGWHSELGDRVVWMARNEQQSAQISINPPQLGPIQIQLNLNGDQVSASFASPFGDVRQAIESALPQLKEMLASAGIDLGQANVGANLAQQQREPHQQPAKARRDRDENAILAASSDPGVMGTALPAAIARGRGMVDLFA